MEDPEVFFVNTTAYKSYKNLVCEIRTPFGANIDSTQYSEFQLVTVEAGSLVTVIKDTVPNLESDEILITWNATSERVYQLKVPDDLINWNRALAGGGITVENNSTMSFQLPCGARVFYRIVLASAEKCYLGS